MGILSTLWVLMAWCFSHSADYIPMCLQAFMSQNMATFLETNKYFFNHHLDIYLKLDI